MATVYDRARGRSHSASRVEALLVRYPGLSEEELAELVDLCPRLDMVARGLMAADDRAGRKVDLSYRDHREKLGRFGAGRKTLIAVIALAAIVIGMTIA